VFSSLLVLLHSINLVLRSIVSGTCRGVTVTFRRPSRLEIPFVG